MKLNLVLSIFFLLILVCSASFAGTSQIIVESTPEGANVYIDGTYCGKTNIVCNASPGTRRVRIEMEDFKPYEKSINLGSDDMKTIKISLARSRVREDNSVINIKLTPETGDLFIPSPCSSKGRLTVDGENYGEAPKKLINLTAESHQVNVSCGGTTYTKKVYVQSNTVNRVDWNSPSSKVPSSSNAPASSYNRNDPVDTIRAYYKDLSNGNVSAVISKWSNPNKSRLTRLVQNVEWFQINSIRSESMDSSNATVQVDVVGKAYGKSPQRWVGTIYLVNIEGNWKISSMSLSIR